MQHTLLSNPQATEDLKEADYSNLLKENMYILDEQVIWWETLD